MVLLIGVPLGAFAADRLLLGTAATIGLQLIFFAKERINDERVQQLKMKAMFTAMSIGIGLTLIAYNTTFMVVRGVSADRPEISAWELLAGILLLAFVCFTTGAGRIRGTRRILECNPTAGRRGSSKRMTGARATSLARNSANASWLGRVFNTPERFNLNCSRKRTQRSQKTDVFSL